MSLEQNQTFASELETQLREAGLPGAPREIVGRLYQFGCEQTAHHHILVGTIQAVEVSDEGGLNFYVTNPRFWGARLISITFSDGKWMAYVDIKPRGWSKEELERMSEEEVDRAIEENIAAKFFEGEFQLL
ncbi:hypothetical protein A2671_00280 [Candidatus Kaiserbacteria bacterium RIFCSPHIGHO2_01_FULL_49_13]|uniref:Uncharacterized protein n=1 Tax=Candidatus Kaiserbacteria bacterium RIFCSPHIGHO2_01_FULL_49_13 TaxID=1798477 RepID=A0A1F6CEJ2_9BACT|nr:MAG: hypothetical protein A2671_00280 [Candidatus Kaiserbacteria bacterium RIFCSPHIGHO2_01_FULL_49_13]